MTNGKRTQTKPKPSDMRSPSKSLNRDISDMLVDAEIFSRTSELEHMKEIRENAADPFQSKFNFDAGFDDGNIDYEN